MRIEIRTDAIFARFGAAIDMMSANARQEMARGLARGGEKLRTPVRRALKEQTSVKRYGTIVANTRGWRDASALTYTIEASGKGLPLSEFPHKASRSKRLALRWSAKEHWRLQKRDGSGRFGVLPGMNDTGVSATMWMKKRGFVRSFVHPQRGPLMQRVAGKKGMRKIYGPSLPKELTIGRTAQTFQRLARSIVMDEIEKRLARLMPK
ncbi:MAG: hypothetical protein K2X62_01360 [Beijerinckiaceae bacterium]|uniref:hypothetical protein n=1 Tax=Methylobacterium sp. TaxID=409 RepID=UPI0025CED144|nr:hypothetical protein [Methylobacterium sp.]MBX9738686.1 hypothetical protein [Beijerinckiaceae bacterium]MBX9934355.1 hypothetical protein [Methylobacterium sp.]